MLIPQAYHEAVTTVIKLRYKTNGNLKLFERFASLSPRKHQTYQLLISSLFKSVNKHSAFLDISKLFYKSVKTKRANTI